MIASLRGTLAEKGVDEAIVDVNGVGYRVFISQVTQANLPAPGENVFLKIRTVIREDAFDLYGFLTETEETLFNLLTSVSQVGPKAAINLMSGLPPEDLAGAIAAGNAAALTKIKGVGKKTADRIVLELRDKVSSLIQGKILSRTGRASGSGIALKAASPVQSDLSAALANMGYKSQIAERLSALAAENLGEDAPIEALLKEALRLSRK